MTEINIEMLDKTADYPRFAIKKGDLYWNGKDWSKTPLIYAFGDDLSRDFQTLINEDKCDSFKEYKIELVIRVYGIEQPKKEDLIAYLIQNAAFVCSKGKYQVHLDPKWKSLKEK